MEIQNPLQMNDWEINKFLTIILSLQLSLIGFILLDIIGIHFPILRELCGFIFLTFMPGYLLLRIFRIHNIGNIRSVFYSVCLSLAFLMFTGFFIDISYPIFGIHNPISLFYLMVTMIFLVGVLSLLSYIIDKDHTYPSYVEIKKILNFKLFFVFLVLFLVVFGTYFAKFYHDNIILMIFILLTCLIVLLVAYNKIPKNLYGVTVFLISLSLVLHITLISNYLTGWDVNGEYYFSNLVNINSFWDIGSFNNNNNSVLSINILAPIYSLILNMELTWVFKIIYPILYSFVPLSLYIVFKSQTNSKIAFMSCMFLVFYSQFFTLSSDKQMIGSIFFVGLIVLLFTPAIVPQKKSILLVVFSASLVVSHYSLSYIFILLLAIYFLIFFILRMSLSKPLLESKIKRIKRFKRLVPNSLTDKVQGKIDLYFFLFLIILTYAWYMSVSSSSGFEAITHIIINIKDNFINDFMSPEAAQGYSLLLKITVSPLHKIFKYILIISQLLITIGLFLSLLNPIFGLIKNNVKFKNDFLILSFASFSILIFSIIIPYFSSSLNTARIYQISLFFLAPFFVIGLIVPLNRFLLFMKWNYDDVPLKITSIFLIIFLLFNSGLIFDVFNDNPFSVPLSQTSIDNHGKEIDKAFIYQTLYFDQDAYGARWLAKNRNDSLKLYADSWQRSLILVSNGIANGTALHNNTNVPKNSYLYFGSVNIRDGIMYESNIYYYKTKDTSMDIDKSNVIYSNGLSIVIFSPNPFQYIINDLKAYQTS